MITNACPAGRFPVLLERRVALRPEAGARVMTEAAFERFAPRAEKLAQAVLQRNCSPHAQSGGRRSCPRSPSARGRARRRKAPGTSRASYGPPAPRPWRCALPAPSTSRGRAQYALQVSQLHGRGGREKFVQRTGGIVRRRARNRPHITSPSIHRRTGSFSPCTRPPLSHPQARFWQRKYSFVSAIDT